MEIELAFDSAVVSTWSSDAPEHYYAEDRFYRHVDGPWYVSTELKARRAVLELRLGV
jgi:hypothetical protein